MGELFEKLKRMQPGAAKAEARQEREPGQCACGGNVEGECPECVPPTPTPQTEEQGDLLQRLQGIGDATGVNPPRPKLPDGQLQCRHCGQLFPADLLADHVRGCKQNPEAKKAAGPGKCPHCAKEFKHLSRHKCKQAPSQEPEPAATETEPEAEPRQPGPYSEGPTAGPGEAGRLFKDQPEQMPPSLTGEPAPAEVKVPDPEPAREDLAVPRKSEADGPDYILLLDAIFERNKELTEVRHFTDIIVPLGRMVATENQVEHWAAVEYGRGPAFLAAKFERWLEATKPSGVIIADSQTAELRACKEILKRRAKVIVQGVR